MTLLAVADVQISSLKIDRDATVPLEAVATPAVLLGVNCDVKVMVLSAINLNKFAGGFRLRGSCCNSTKSKSGSGCDGNTGLDGFR